MSIELLAILSAVAFLLASFFAGAETAIIATDPIRLRHLVSKGGHRARLLRSYRENPEYFLSIVLVGTNLGMIGCTATFTAIMIELYGEVGATLAPLILVPLLMVFQEIVPKGIFLYYSHQGALASIYPLRFFAIVLFPLIKSFSGLTNGLARLFGVGKMDAKVQMTMEELVFHLQDSRRAGAISADTMVLASRAFELLDIAVRDVMVPIERVVMVPEGLTLEEYQDIFVRERFSRMPVYRGRGQEVVGVLSVRNLLKARRPKSPRLVLAKPYVVRADAPVVEVLVRMKNQGTPMAMIEDQSKKLVGMVTLEDILERLVGAIADEFH